ncbi:hypothetical protein [Thermanaeromonas toyohensis]|nr:hypothetical protein [Thermanaeromonas toyohensis]
MRGYFRFMAKGVRVDLKVEQAFLKEVLGDTLKKFLEGCLMSGICEWKPVEEDTPATPTSAPTAVPVEQAEPLLTLPELRAQANVANNKELVTLVIYYADYCQKNPPSNEEIRRLLREELREKDVVLNSMTTYLQRAKRQGWVAQEGKRWRITSTGLQKIQQMLGSSTLSKGA